MYIKKKICISFQDPRAIVVCLFDRQTGRHVLVLPKRMRSKVHTKHARRPLMIKEKNKKKKHLILL